ncbi:MAG: bifunctional precorrin-2 dehydrogenase/sirohydrochlorin ferrochelatase [Planctomycetota bacterium]
MDKNIENRKSSNTKKYMPVCLNLNGKEVVVYGGGKIAYQKTRTLVRYGARVTVIAEKFDEKFNRLKNVTLIAKKIGKSDLKSKYSFVICALNDKKLNEKIYEFYTNKNIPVNVVDNRELCSVIFPAILNQKDISIAISTNGKMAGLSRYLKQSLKKWLHKDTHKLLRELARMRIKLKKKIPSFEKRQKIIRKILNEYDFFSKMQHGESFQAIKEKIKDAFSAYV